VVLHEDRAIGCLALRPDGDVIWLEHFYLAPAWQGRGIGDALLRRITAEAGTLRLNVLQGSPARRLYERHGFVVDTEDEIDVYMSRLAGQVSRSATS
jgi:GNAT superfamily N-acetyltransferase